MPTTTTPALTALGRDAVNGERIVWSSAPLTDEELDAPEENDEEADQ